MGESTIKPKSVQEKGKRTRTSESENTILKWDGLRDRRVRVLATIGIGFCLLLFAGRFLSRRVGGVSWTAYTMADGHVSVMLPGNPKVRQLTGGSEFVYAASGSISCGISVESTGMTDIGLERLSTTLKTKRPNLNARIELIHGKKVLRSTEQYDSTSRERATFAVDGKTYFASFKSDDPVDPSVSEYFFQSIHTQ